MKKRINLFAFIFLAIVMIFSVSACGEAEMTKIGVDTQPTKVAYFVGEKLDLSGMVIMAYYDDESSEVITDYTTSIADGAVLKAEDKSVTITYGEMTTSVSITVAEVSASSIAVTTNPTKTTYYAGEELDLDGLVVTANYNDGSTSVITDYTTSIANDATLAVTDTKVTVSYGTLSASFNISVTAVSATSIAVTTAPTATYYEGEELDLSGMVVTATYNNGTSSAVTDYTTSIADGTVLGTSDTSVTITYQGKTTSVSLTIIAKAVSSVEITTEPTNTTYYAGEELDLDGLVVTANYNDGSSSVVTSYTTSIADGTVLASSDTSVTVTYGEKTDTFNITVTDIADDNGTLSAFRMEAENAVVSLVGGDTFTDTTKIALGADFSGGLSTSGCNSVSGGTSDTTTFSFTSDKTVVVDMEMVVSNNTGTEHTLASLLSITSNGIEVAGLADIDMSEGLTNYCSYSSFSSVKYWYYKTVTVSVPIFEGSNSIVVSQKLNNVGGNLDYVELNTSATITDWDDTYYNDTTSTWTITTEPTLTANGTLTVTDTSAGTKAFSTIPMLSLADYYTVVDNGDETNTYSITIGAESYDFTIDVPNEYTLTLADGCGYTFAESETTATLIEGDSLPSVVKTADNTETRTLTGWYDVADKTYYGTTSGFLMGDSNMTIAPYYAPTGAVTTNVSMTTANNCCTMANLPAYTNTNTIVGDEVGKIFTDINGDAGEYFRFMRAYKIAVDTTYDFSFTFENLGDSAVSFDVWQVSSGVDMSGATPSVCSDETITIASGEIASVTLTLGGFTATNTNIMTIIKFTDSVANGALGVAEAVNINTDPVVDPDDTGDTTPADTATLSFADGCGYSFADSTSVDLESGDSLPSYTYTGDESRTLVGFYNTNDRTEYWTASAFTMGDADMTIAPYYTNENAVNSLNTTNYCLATYFTNDLTTTFEQGMATDALGMIHTISCNDGGSMRLMRAYSVVAASYEFTYTFANLGDEEISFYIYQVTGSSDYTNGGDNSALENEYVTLSAGETKSVTLEMTFTASNGNLIAFLEMDCGADESIDGAVLGYSQQVVKVV